MGLKTFPVPGKSKSAMLCDAFAAGAPRDAVGSVFYGVKQGNYGDWLRVQSKRADWYFIDGSYFDTTRGAFFRVTKNKLQHSGDGDSDCLRFGSIRLPIQPWKTWTQPGYALIVEQSDDHMRYTLQGAADGFIQHAVDFHAPQGSIRVRHWSADKPKLQVTLAEDLIDARMLITHTSAAAVMAALAGVMPICATPCAAHGMTRLRNRLQWAGVLADNQFTIAEMKDGTAWRKLNP